MRACFAVRVVWKLVLAIIVCGASFASAADELAVYAYRYRSHELGTKGLWAVMLRFDNPVFSSEVAKATKVTVEGVQKHFELQDPDSGEKVAWATASMVLVPTEASDRPASVAITVAKGLSDASGRHVLAKDFTYQVRSFEIITVTGISTFYASGDKKGLKISLSSHVSERDLAGAITIYPAVGKLDVTRGVQWNY